MAGFTNFFPDDTPDAVAGQSYSPGDLVFYNSNVYACTTAATLSNPIVSADFDTNFALLSGGDAAVASAVDDLNSTDNITFWTGTRAEYDAITTPDANTIYYITDEAAVIGTFLGLDDVRETSYTGHAGQVAVVNAAEDGLEFAEQTGGVIDPTIDVLRFGTFATPGDPSTAFTQNAHTHATSGAGDDVEIIVSSLIRPLNAGDPASEFRIQNQAQDAFVTITPVVFVNSTTVRLVLPSRTDGTYTLAVVNPDGRSGTLDVVYSAGPEWQTAEALGSFAPGADVNISFSAFSDGGDGTGITYEVIGTPNLPTGLSFSSLDAGQTSLTLSGTVPVGEVSATYSFTVRASENTGDGTQSLDRTFTLGIAPSIFGTSLGRSLLLEDVSTNAPLAYYRVTNTGIPTNSSDQNFSHSLWVKRTQVGPAAGNRPSVIASYFNNGSALGRYYSLSFGTNDTIRAVIGTSGSNNVVATSTAVFRDTSAWYHIYVNYNSTTNTLSVYVNGVEVATGTGAVGTNSWFANINWDFSYGHNSYTSAADTIALYMARVDFVLGDPLGGSGQAPPVTAFGEFSNEGYWQPVEYTLGGQANGSHSLDFTTDFGTNSGTANSIVDTLNGYIFQTNVVQNNTFFSNDTVTNNYANLFEAETGNVNARIGGNRNVTFTNANRTAASTDTGGDAFEYTHRIPKQGKYYWEVTYNNFGSGSQNVIGCLPGTSFRQNGIFTAGQGYWRYQEGGTVENATASGTAVASVTQGQSLGIALDMDLGQVQFYINGTASGDHYTINGFDNVDDGGYIVFGGNDIYTATINSGQTDFDLTTLPTGFGPLSAATLPDPSLVPNEHFAVANYTGDRTNGVTRNLEFAPDFVWIGPRSFVDHPQIYDTIRGGTSRQYTSGISGWGTNTNAITFSSNGFTVGADNSQQINRNGQTFHAAAFRAGGAAVANNDGSVQTMVSANTDAGFSMVNWAATGSSTTSTRGHGLNQAPEIIILASEGSTNMWTSIDRITGNSGDYINASKPGFLNTVAGQFGDATDSVFSVRESVFTGTGGVVAYCWHSVPGYSDIGQYTGNGDADGPFINCGFKPALIWIKAIDDPGGGGGFFYSYDNQITPHNPVNRWNRLNDTGNESSSGYHLDFLSNGFKHINSNADVNRNSTRFMYMAFAESPFKYSLGR